MVFELLAVPVVVAEIPLFVVLAELQELALEGLVVVSVGQVPAVAAVEEVMPLLEVEEMLEVFHGTELFFGQQQPLVLPLVSLALLVVIQALAWGLVMVAETPALEGWEMKLLVEPLGSVSVLLFERKEGWIEA